MSKTMKKIAEAAERRWAQNGYTEAQKQVLRQRKQFVITPSGTPTTHINKEELLQRRIEMDHRLDELNNERALKEVWDE